MSQIDEEIETKRLHHPAIKISNQTEKGMSRRLDFYIISPYIFTILTIASVICAIFIKEDKDVRSVLFLFSGMFASFVISSFAEKDR